MNGFEFSHRADPFTARELVNLGCHHRRVRDGLPEPVPGCNVTLEPGVPCVDDEESGDAVVWSGGWAW
jgi:hypothetical protein